MKNLNDHMVNSNLVPYMKSLSLCLNELVLQGYDNNFLITESGLQSLKTEKIYQPKEISVVNFFRFEGQSDPDDSAIMYVIETDDGLKGTIVDSYGPNAEKQLSDFMIKVKDFKKKE